MQVYFAFWAPEWVGDTLLVVLAITVAVLLFWLLFRGMCHFMDWYDGADL